MTAPPATHTIADHLPTPLQVGVPDVMGALVVFPLFGPQPRLEYRSFAQGAALGVTI